MELRARLDKGLCFSCNDKYFHGHHCKVKENKEPMLFIMNEEEELEEGLCENEGHEVIKPSMPKDAEVAPRTIKGFTAKGTLKLKGEIKGKGAIVLN